MDRDLLEICILADALDRHAMNGQSAVCDKRVWRPQDEEEELELERHALNPYEDWKPAIWHPRHGIHTGASHPYIIFKALERGVDLADDDSVVDGFLRPDGSFATRADATNEGHTGESISADQTGNAEASASSVDVGKGWGGNRDVWDRFDSISGSNSYDHETKKYDPPAHGYGKPWWSQQWTHHHAELDAIARIDVGGT